jgi:hypothetical protein
MSLDAMKQALEALEFDGFTPEDATHRHYTTKAITALKAALEQPEPEPEPVAWMHKETGLLRREISRPKAADWDSNYWQPLYTAPRQWVGLTNKDVIEMWPETSTVGWDDIRLIEAKLKEKNT